MRHNKERLRIGNPTPFRGGRTSEEITALAMQPLQTQPTTKKELWKPETLQTKGVSQAIKWLMENLPETTVTIEDVVKWAYEEQGFESAR
jgi:SOS response regulatory protein OraA/RecX